MDEKSALRATDFEFTDERREFRREIPSRVKVGAVFPEMGAGASGSVGMAL